MGWQWAMAVGGMMAVTAAGALAPGDHAQEIRDWRTQRVERLQAPGGWLSLIGLHWLEPGEHRIGSAPGNDIVLAKGPAEMGVLEVGDAGNVLLRPGPEAGLQVRDAAGGATPVEGSRPIRLAADASGTPTVVGFDQDRGSFMLIERGGRHALRVRHADAGTRTGFTGIDYFDIDPSWRMEARFEPHPPGSTIEIANVVNQLEPMANPGAVVFERDGKTFRLEAVDEGDGQLFLIFADRTSGKTTYGAGRFLYADPPAAGSDRVVLDFNRAYNPPCAFNAYSTCPLPPPENRLDLAVTVGEKRYAGPTH